MQAGCDLSEHAGSNRSLSVSEATLERCARIFRAMGDPGRLRLLAVLASGPACVGDLLQLEGDTMASISQRLRVLRAEDIVRRRREGKHVVYTLADQHTRNLINDGLAHASEHLHGPKTNFNQHQSKENIMSQEHITHANHTHEHGEECGHTAIKHEAHTDYLHDGHLHHLHEGHVDEHKLEVNAANPADCTNGHDCGAHDAKHVHGKDCGHDAVPHGDHVDYLVDGHLHHQHDGHCDNHGQVEIVQ